jgi:hypothetical protein
LAGGGERVTELFIKDPVYGNQGSNCLSIHIRIIPLLHRVTVSNSHRIREAKERAVNNLA